MNAEETHAFHSYLRQITFRNLIQLTKYLLSPYRGEGRAGLSPFESLQSIQGKDMGWRVERRKEGEGAAVRIQITAD